MSLSKQWYTTTDVALTSTTTAALTNANMLWLFKQLLTGAATGTVGPEGAAPSSSYWTVVQSCDSTQVKTDGTDTWSAVTFDSTKMVWGTGVHSWVVLRSPTALGTGGPYYLTWDLANASSGIMTIRLSRGTAPTGGTTSAAPTASGDSLLSSIAWTPNSLPSLGAKVHKTVDANGNFWLLYGATNNGAMNVCMMVNQLINLRYGSEIYDVVFGVEQNSTTNLLKEGQSGLLAAGAGFLRCWNYNGGSSQQSTISTIGFGSFFSATITAAHGGDGLWQTIPATVWILPTAATGQIKGDLPDVFVAPVAIGQGAREPASGTIERVLFGGLFLPFSVVPTM